MCACLWPSHRGTNLWSVDKTNTRSAQAVYIDDIAWAFAGSRQEIEDFVTFEDGFDPSLKFTFSISDEQLPFHDLVLSQQLIVLLQAYIAMQLKLILTLIMLPCTPLVFRKLSPTVSFSAYGASAATRQILKKTAKACFFPRRRGYSQRIHD